MWVVKIAFDGGSALLGSLAKEFKVSVSGYPISAYKHEDHIRACFVICVSGEEKAKDGFFESLVKHSRIFNIERSGDFFIGEVEESVNASAIYEYKLIHIEPLSIKENGMEYWTLGSWKKETLMEFAEMAKRDHGAEILGFYKKDIRNFSILSMQPNLTSKQKAAMDSAVKNGYYNYPRNISIEKLAKLSNISFSTFHAHLRKAEQKLLPHFHSNNE